MLKELRKTEEKAPETRGKENGGNDRRRPGETGTRAKHKEKK